MANKVYHFNLTGGEDKVSADADIPNGTARTLYNYEQDYRTGYTRISGYRKLVNDTLPGEGDILGLTIYDDVIYMFRNKTGGAACGIWKAIAAEYNDAVNPPTITSNGSWTVIDAANILDKDGAPVVLEPDGYYEYTIHNFKATSRDYGDYQKDWNPDTQYYIGDIVDQGGLVYITERNHLSAATFVEDAQLWETMDWTSDVNTREAHDISGSSGNLYGVDGKNPAFEFDGTDFKQIDSTYTNDTPQHIEANGNRLVLGFRAGEIAISQLGVPTGFDPVYGAGSIGVTDFLTGMMAGPDNVLYIFAKNKVYLLYGMGGPLDQMEMKKHSKDVGAYPFSEQILGGRALFWDQWGLTELKATDVFGDVVSNALSDEIQPLLVGKQPINSVILKDKAQYRSYFQSVEGADSTSTCLIATLLSNPEEGAKDLGFTHAVYPFKVSTAVAGRVENEDFHLVGAEINQLTHVNEVYQMDVGNSFDGEAYLSYINIPFHHMGSPYITKKWKKVRMNIRAPSATSFVGQTDFSYGAADVPSDYGEDSTEGEGILWNEGVWGEFSWTGSRHSQVEAYMNGHGENISVILQSNSSTEKPHTLQDISYIYENLQIEH